MSEKKYEVRKPVNIKAETKGLVKDWLLFLGEIIKASVEGVVEFWGKKEEPAEPVVEALPVVDTEELSEEDEEILAVVEEAEETEEAEEPAEEVVLSRRERRRAGEDARVHYRRRAGERAFAGDPRREAVACTHEERGGVRRGKRLEKLSLHGGHRLLGRVREEAADDV